MGCIYPRERFQHHVGIAFPSILRSDLDVVPTGGLDRNCCDAVDWSHMRIRDNLLVLRDNPSVGASSSPRVLHQIAHSLEVRIHVVHYHGRVPGIGFHGRQVLIGNGLKLLILKGTAQIGTLIG
jgi:hypothetical protein